jgi:hypothetical protein
MSKFGSMAGAGEFRATWADVNVALSIRYKG